MLDELNSLPEVVDVDWSFPTASKLPKLISHFYVPRLEDKPQNPIIARLQDLEHHLDPFSTQDVVEELVVDNEEIVREDDKERDSDVWLQSLATLGNPNVRARKLLSTPFYEPLHSVVSLLGTLSAEHVQIIQYRHSFRSNLPLSYQPLENCECTRPHLSLEKTH